MPIAIKPIEDKLVFQSTPPPPPPPPFTLGIMQSNGQGDKQQFVENTCFDIY